MIFFAQFHQNIPSLLPASERLFIWLQQAWKPGKPYEFWISDFQEDSKRFRLNGKPYSRIQVTRALNELVSKGLVDILYRFSYHCYKIIVHRTPRSETNESQSETNHTQLKTNEKQASNPDSFVPIYIENIDNKHSDVCEINFFNERISELEQVKAVVEEVEEETSIKIQVKDIKESKETLKDITISNFDQNSPKSLNHNKPIKKDKHKEVKPNEDEEIHKEFLKQEFEPLFEQAEDLGVKLHPQMVTYLLEFAYTAVQNALLVLKKAKAKTEVKNPTGFLRQALEENWDLNTNTLRLNADDMEFHAWYPIAVASKWVLDIPINWLSKFNEGYQVRVPDESTSSGYRLEYWRSVAGKHRS